MKKIYTSILLVTITLTSWSQNLIVRSLEAHQVTNTNIVKLPNEVKRTWIELNLSHLNDKSNISFKLNDVINLELEHTKTYQYTNGAWSWYGRSVHHQGDMILSFCQGNVSGIVVDDLGNKYILQQLHTSKIFALSEVNRESMQESNFGIPDYIEVTHGSGKKSRANADVCAVGNTCSGISTIDIMVLGASAAITNGGGTVASFTSNVASAITEMNTAYTNSGGTNLVFNLVHCDATAFATTSNMNNDLSNFASDAGVQTLRNTYGADLVGLWAGSGSYAGFCGLGYLNTNPTNYNNTSAYTVTDYGCGMTNLSFAHECGHNMGLRHDYYVDTDITPCAHHHGYTNQVVIPSGNPTSGRWRTIMAYNNECMANGFNCTRLARWSNPSSSYLGDPTGIAIGSANPANEIYGFERFRCVVADFRTSPMPVQLLNFESKSGSNFIDVSWLAAQEVNFKGYEVEFKYNEEEFKKVLMMDTKNSTEYAHNYQGRIYNLLPGRYYIRLKMLDLDGKYTYSKILQTEIFGQNFIAEIFPNPSNGDVILRGFSPKLEKIEVNLIDLTGRKFPLNLNDKVVSNEFILPINLKDIPKGIYLCEILAGKERKNFKITLVN